MTSGSEIYTFSGAIAAAKPLQSCPTLCDPIDGSPPGSPVPGILQARTLEWVAISFSHAWKWTVKVKSLSRVRLFATPWTAAYQAPLSMGFSRQGFWSGVPLSKSLVWRASVYWAPTVSGNVQSALHSLSQLILHCYFFVQSWCSHSHSGLIAHLCLLGLQPYW